MTPRLPSPLPLLALLLFTLVGAARAQTLDRKDFSSPQSPGATTVLQGSGTVNGSPTSFRQTNTIVGPATLNGQPVTRGNQTIEFSGITALSSIYLDQFESVYRSDVSSNGQTLQSLIYSPALNPFPRFFAVGQQFNYGTSISGTVSGNLSATGQIAGTITVVGTERVLTSVGTFEAVKANIAFRQDLTWSTGYQQTTANRTIWVARGVGAVRFQSNESVAGSTGAPTTVTYDLTLASANYSLSPQPVFPVPAFFAGAADVGGGFSYLPSFGYYKLLAGSPGYVYHNDLGFLYVIDAQDGKGGAYFYDFATTSGGQSLGFFYTSPSLFPYLYSFGLNTFVYYFSDAKRGTGFYTTSPRVFSRLDTGEVLFR